jgi:hypothetical protein
VKYFQFVRRSASAAPRKVLNADKFDFLVGSCALIAASVD